MTGGYRRGYLAYIVAPVDNPQGCPLASTTHPQCGTAAENAKSLAGREFLSFPSRVVPVSTEPTTAAVLLIRHTRRRKPVDESSNQGDSSLFSLGFRE
jgi:hypothetical protein